MKYDFSENVALDADFRQVPIICHTVTSGDL